MLNRLKTRQIKWKKLSKNDLKLLEDEEYLNNYIYFFDRVIEIFEKLNKKMWEVIKINKIDTTNLPKPWLQI
jgi:predicted HTH transcriptional regulator